MDAYGSPLAPASSGPQGAPLAPVGLPAPPSGPGTPTFSGEINRDGRDLDERPDRPLLRRTSPWLYVTPLVLLLGLGAVWWFVLREVPAPVVEPEPVVEPTRVVEAPAPELVPEPVVPEPVPTDPTPVPVPGDSKAIATQTGKTGASKTGASKPGTSKTGSKTGSNAGKVGGASKPRPEPIEPGPSSGQPGKQDAGRVIMELEMLSAAKKSLAGNPGQALAYVEQHDREFPTSQLTDKFDEVRIKALCGLGRDAQARTLANSILKKRPGSLVGAAVKECKA